MAVIGLDVNQTWEYKLVKDTKDPTIFHLGFLDGSLWMQLKDEGNEYEGDPGVRTAIKTHWNKVAYELVRFGVRDVKNLKNSKGEIVPFKSVDVFAYGKNRKAVNDEFLNMFSDEVIRELANEIYSKQSMTATEVKNSQGQS